MKNKNFARSFINAVNGIISTIKTERNMKFHIAAAAIVIFLSFYYKLEKIEIISICFAVAGVIICELFNTAVEALVNIIVDIDHPKAKIIKDIAAAAVLVSAIAALIVGYFIFFDRIYADAEFFIKYIKKYF